MGSLGEGDLKSVRKLNAGSGRPQGANTTATPAPSSLGRVNKEKGAGESPRSHMWKEGIVRRSNKGDLCSPRAYNHQGGGIREEGRCKTSKAGEQT